MSMISPEQEPRLPRLLQFSTEPEDDKTVAHVHIDAQARAEDIEFTLSHLEPNETVQLNYKKALLRWGVTERGFYDVDFATEIGQTVLASHRVHITFADVEAAFTQRYGEALLDIALLASFRDFANNGRFARADFKLHVNNPAAIDPYGDPAQ